jgi:hypothetical protein
MAAELKEQRANMATQPVDEAVAKPKAPIVPISWGELIDKITILEVKAERLTSPQPLANVRRELAALEAVLHSFGDHGSRVAELRAALRAINAEIFDLEDAIRAREAQQLFDDKFIELARSIYFSNDRRGQIKRAINAMMNSEFVEEKQYANY